MKWTTVMLLIVLAFTVLTPSSSFSLVAAAEQGGEEFANLDVCHSAAPALSANGEMPFLNMAIADHVPVFLRTTDAPYNPVFTELILTTRNEQPPQA
ncbi:MAG: hypothetical protein ACYC7L_11000 [Nitrospirota bacterium]